MDLRDEFACQAMNGFISGFCAHENTAPINQLSHRTLATEAYVVAECMIDARKTSEQGESPATAGNSDYAAALKALDEWKEEFDVCEGDKCGFEPWLRSRLNSVKAPNCA
jgi:hypothetical protein